MPPPEAKKPPLKAEDVELIRRWIDAGAEYDDHWSFAKVSRPPVPATPFRSWARNPIDGFIAAEFARHGLRPAPEADRRTLVRRLFFDLLGVPPTPDETNAFVSDRGPDAYERLVDRVLSSPRYGERMAATWLDLVRYADTDGYSVDADPMARSLRTVYLPGGSRSEASELFSSSTSTGTIITELKKRWRVRPLK